MDELIITFILVLVLSIVLEIITFCVDEDCDIIKISSTIIAALLFLVCGGILNDIKNYNKMPAIDVYRGKTTLQITYQDGIPVDTVVVFKNR